MLRQAEKSEIMALKKRVSLLEKQLSDFTSKLSKINRADIDYIAMETDVELDQEVENA